MACCVVNGQVLENMRGTRNVDAEWDDIKGAVEEVKAHDVRFWKSLGVLFSRRYWKLAVASAAIPFFQQFTGMNAIMFYGASLHALTAKQHVMQQLLLVAKTQSDIRKLITRAYKSLTQ
jgi:hypothetical protein